MANTYIIGNNLVVTGSVTASQGFYGDGSGLTTITASAEWDGSRNGNAEITGSFVVSGSGAVVDFANVISNLGTTNITGSVTITGSLSQGFLTIASGYYSHAEGGYTQAIGESSHAEGYNTLASGSYSHAEGGGTQALGYSSHAEGLGTIATGSHSHAEGSGTLSGGSHSHAEGIGTQAVGDWSHAEGNSAESIGQSSHAEGQGTIASGSYSHAEGGYTQAIGESSHAEGQNTQAIGESSHAEGQNTQARGEYSHAEGEDTQAVNYGSHAEGYLTVASGSYSHAEGYDTEARANASHAEGYNTLASGSYSHAEGGGTIASGDYSHAEGYLTVASGIFSHAEGVGTIALGDYQHVQGQYNISSSAQSAFIIGNGTSNINRSNLVNTSGSQFQITGSLNVQGTTNITGNVVTQGSINVTGGVTGSLLGTASYALSAIALPAGTDTQVQFNNAGALNGATGLTYDSITNTVNQGIGNTVDSTYANYSHAEGASTVIKSAASHTEGLYTKAYGDYSHAEGLGTATGTDKAYYVSQVLNGKVFFDLSYGNITSKYFTGNYIQISAPGSGVNVVGKVLGKQYIAGVGTIVTSSLSTNLAAFGPTIVSINASTSPSSWTGDTQLGATAANTRGENTVSTGGSSHAEGFYTLVTGYAAHAEGYYTKALGQSSHAEGNTTTALGDYSHAEGSNTEAIGLQSHAEGYLTIASGSYSHAEGFGTIAVGEYQHVQGQYNIESPVKGAFIVGNGTFTNKSNLIFTTGSQVQITGSLLVTGSAIVVGGITGSLLGTASFADLAYAIPGGTDTQIQYNNNGVLAGTTNLTWNSVNSTLNGNFTGDGSGLTGLVSPTAQTATSASHAIQADNALTVTGYNHIQSSPATTWTITHNLNNQYPIVQVYNTDNIMIIPEEVQGTNTNTTTIQFSFAMAGYARIL